VRKPSLAWCLPAYGVMGLLTAVPLLACAALSFFSADLKRPDLWGFTGAANYLRLLGDGRAWASVARTLFFTLGSVLIEGVLALGLALLLRSRIRLAKPLKWMWVLPWATPTVVAGLMGRFMLYDSAGPLNGLFLALGLQEGSASWLSGPFGAWTAVLFVDVWKTFPFISILLFAGLCQIPDSAFESAAVDGAGNWACFWHVTLPLLAPVLGVALLLRALDALRIFDIVFVMTGGGPGTATETLSLYTYKILMTQLDFGYGSVLALVTFACACLISAGALAAFRRWWR
jgi:multiple sugar transport system permease protein